MKIRLVLLILLSVLSINSISAQKSSKKITITGVVLDVDKSPIVNAIVMIDGQKTNTLTDANGKFKIKVKPDALKIGIFTFGSGIKEEEINGRTEITINFGTIATQQVQSEEIKPGEEGVNTGYSYVKRKKLTEQISKVDGTKSKYASYSSVSEMIIREVGGVKFNGSEYIIQGSKNIDGPVAALLIIDGVYVGSFDGVSPSTVESIEVLKGSSAAMYGSRGSGGVIILKTKIQNK